MDRRQSVLGRYLTKEEQADIDPFDLDQLEAGLTVCRDSRNLSDAGRRLFAVSRQAKKNPNDADRLRESLDQALEQFWPLRSRLALLGERS